MPKAWDGPRAATHRLQRTASTNSPQELGDVPRTLPPRQEVPHTGMMLTAPPRGASGAAPGPKARRSHQGAGNAWPEHNRQPPSTAKGGSNHTTTRMRRPAPGPGRGRTRPGSATPSTDWVPAHAPRPHPNPGHPWRLRGGNKGAQHPEQAQPQPGPKDARGSGRCHMRSARGPDATTSGRPPETVHAAAQQQFRRELQSPYHANALVPMPRQGTRKAQTTRLQDTQATVHNAKGTTARNPARAFSQALNAATMNKGSVTKPQSRHRPPHGT